MNVAFTLNFTGTPDAEDALAARHIIATENARRAASTPPGTPLPASNAAEIKASYLTVLLDTVNKAHLNYAQQARSVSGIEARFSAASLETIRANLTTRLNNGEAEGAIVADTAS